MQKLCSSIVIAFALCLSSRGEQVRFEDLYGVSLTEAPKVFGNEGTRQLTLALEDFNAALKGRHPKHAKFKPSAKPNFCYAGDGYSICILETPIAIKNADSEVVFGYIYGPQLTFHSESATNWGETPAISRTRFYRTEEIKQLKRRSPEEIEEQRQHLEQVKEEMRRQIEAK